MTKFPHFLVFGIFFLLIFMTVFSSVSEAREKHALIIANKDYIHGGSLTNPIKDSKALAKTLRNAGFSVSIRENLSYTKMRTAISEFGLQHSATDNVALVYYSGHGAEFDGVNYLIPVDAKLDDARKARQEAMTLRDVQNFMYREISDEEKATGKNAKGLNIIVLDACRNNPYPARQKSRNRGLGKFEGASGTMIWYAAQPGAKANDGNNDDLSPFAASFVEAIDNSKGEAVEDTFKEVARLTLKKTQGVQEPWLSGNILGRFSFTPGRGRNTAYRYLSEYDPAQLDRPANFVPKPKEWTSVRKTFGNWKFGSMGKYFGDTFVSFGGIWYETGSEKLPYVVFMPANYTSKFYFPNYYVEPDHLNIYGAGDSEGRINTKKGNSFEAVLWLIFSNGLPVNGQPYLYGRNITINTWEGNLKYNVYCMDKKLYKGCQYPYVLTGEALKWYRKEKTLWIRKSYGENKESLVTIPMKEWANITKYQHLMEKFARINNHNAHKGKHRTEQNLRQCVLEYERIIFADYDPVNNKHIIGKISREYLDLALKQIKNHFENGDRECAFIYGYIFSAKKFRHLWNELPNAMPYRDALKLALEGYQQHPRSSLRTLAQIVQIDLIRDQLTSAEILDFSRYPNITGNHTIGVDYFKKLAAEKREQELFNLAEKASHKCRELKDQKNLSAALNCYQEFTELFPNKLNHIDSSYSQVKQLAACGPAKKIWKYLKYSQNIESLNIFISEHPKCAVAQSAKLRIEELQKQ